MKPFTRFTGTLAPLPVDNVDTDQIIPASFLKGVDREGMAEGLFHGWRFLEDGSPDPDFVLHDPEFRSARILLVGDNFGGGSSREHAPWALQAWGFQALIGKGFADIFRNNAHRNGLLTVSLSSGRYQALLSQVQRDSSVMVTLDLLSQVVTFPDGTTERLDVDPFARHCMLNGLDPMDHLLDQLPHIEEHEARTARRIRIPYLGAGPEGS